MPFPNPATQFRPGNPGGPGRPRSKPLTDRIHERLEEPVEDGRALADVLVDRWLEMIKAGDVTALKALLDRIEGKVVNSIVHDGDLTIRVEYAEPGEDAMSGALSILTDLGFRPNRQLDEPATAEPS